MDKKTYINYPYPKIDIFKKTKEERKDQLSNILIASLRKENVKVLQEGAFTRELISEFNRRIKKRKTQDIANIIRSWIFNE